MTRKYLSIFIACTIMAASIPANTAFAEESESAAAEIVLPEEAAETAVSEEELFPDESADDVEIVPEDTVSAEEDTLETEPDLSDGTVSIDAVEVMDEDPALAMPEAAAEEETIPLTLGKTIPCTFENGNIIDFSFSPDESGAYSILVSEFACTEEDRAVTIQVTNPDDFMSVATYYFDSMNKADIVTLEAGTDYRFEAEADGYETSAPVSCNLTLIKTPSVKNISINGEGTEIKLVKGSQAYYEQNYQYSFADTLSDQTLYVTYQGNQEPEYVNISYSWEKAEDTYGHCFSVKEAKEMEPWITESTWDEFFREMPEGGYSMTVQCQGDSYSEEPELEVPFTVTSISMEEAAQGNVFEDNAFSASGVKGPVYAVFSPSADGTYLFTYASDDNLCVFDQNGNLLEESDQGDAGYDYETGKTQFYVELSAGAKYYVAMNPGEDGTVSVEVMKYGNVGIEKIELGQQSALEGWNMLNVSEKMQELSLKVTYEDGTTEILDGWSILDDYIWARTEHGDQIQLRLYENEGNAAVPYSYENRFMSRPVPAGSHRLVVRIGEEGQDTDLANVTVAKSLGAISTTKLDVDHDYPLNIAENAYDIYAYTPAVRGKYTMYTSFDGANDSYDTIVFLFDDGYNCLVGQDDGGEGLNFALTYVLEAGRTYYYALRHYNVHEEIAETTMHFSKAISITGAKLISPPAKTEYKKGIDTAINVTGLQVELTYSDSAKWVAAFTDNTIYSKQDKYGNTVSLHLRKYGAGNAEHNSYDESMSLQYTDSGVYWLCAEVDEIYGDENYETIFHLPIQITIDANHIHSCTSWTVTTPATVFAEGVQSGVCSQCGAPQTQAIPRLTPVLQLTADSISMKKGQSTTKLKVTEMAAGDSLVSVTSSDKKVLKVSAVKPDGTFKLKASKLSKKGVNLTITLASGESRTVKVKVQAKKVTTKSIKGVQKKLTMQVKQKMQLEPVVTPITTQDKLTYTTSNKKIATVSKKGLITAKKKGKVTITIKSGKKKINCKVTIK